MQPPYLFSRVEAFAKHGVRLSRSGLAVGKYCAIEAIDDVIDAIVDIVEQLVLTRILIKDDIELGLHVVAQIGKTNQLLVLHVDNDLTSSISRKYWSHPNGYIKPLGHRRSCRLGPMSVVRNVLEALNGGFYFLLKV